ncbi:MAG: late competence development ComFB family protein [Pseudanabaenaceae cyanobacterium SKYGB_i_bin29]|nr:late competence development ComFB family protein [Pseudanabaenaceae cyanobacterium SKYG29]MDW8422458.1 late competence development ComFB family protein [Pseudanabaenaceae cyanobacterium SKYGB_i_bin29]
MDDCKNVIEDLVVREVKEQLEILSESVRATISPHEVAAYALNRLPTLYATSRDGWHQQRQRAEKELKKTIEQQVKRAIVAVRRDTMRPADPLPPEEMAGEARALAKLRKILQRENLTWNEVPQAVEEALKTIKIRGALEYKKLSESKRSAIAVQDYLKRRKVQAADWKGRESFAYFGTQPKTVDKEFATYLEAEGADFVNVLERLVYSLAEQYLQRSSPHIREKVNLYEVVAYTLNRVPPMYATTAKGLKELRQKAKEEHGKQIVNTIHEAVTVVLHNPHRSVAPLPFKRWQGDCQAALKKLEKILHVTDVDCSNVALIVADALDQTISGFIT